MATSKRIGKPAGEVYTRAGLGGDLTLGKQPAVLVVDLICGFTDPKYRLGTDLTAVVEATQRLLGVARAETVPILFTTVAYERSLGDCGIWLQKMPALAELQLSTGAAEIDERLCRRENETVVVKKGASALFGTNLLGILNSRHVDTVVLCGATTSGCVRATAVDLCQNGYPAVVPVECVGDRADAPHEANLFDMQAKYVDVVSLNDVIAYIDSIRNGVGGGEDGAVVVPDTSPKAWL